jgi:predicted dehydrogenase
MDSATMKIALVGCGQVTESLHLPALRAVPEVRVAALADVDAAALDAVGERFSIARRATDFRVLLEDPELELFGVCVPPAAHAEVAGELIGAGRHVLVEKPLALTLEDCERLMGAAREAGVRATVGFNLRRHRLVEAAREQLRAGALGRVALLSSTFTSDAGLGSADQDTLLERGIHHFDLWRHLLGSEVVEISAMAAGSHTAVVNARSANGALITGQFSESSAAANELAAYGDSGQLHLSCDRFDGLEVIPRPGYRGDMRVRANAAARTLAQLPGVVRARRHGGDMQRSYAAEWRHLARAIRDGTPAEPALEDGRQAVAILLGAKASLAGGGAPVAVPSLEPSRAAR